ncbi:MAG: large subunit ribosomal protein [Verrucomicrobiota bacterium]|jgi:large subunit ribosomal protein L6|nr:large subunit ribosomal protein [Verrucomicrobiota bacterium]MDK2962974.1 large subunit ribosomal protein [Verrucomicrobiota bacterium]
MSRIGKSPVTIPPGVDVSVNGNIVTVKGPKGQSSWELPLQITAAVEKGLIQVVRKDETNESLALHGTVRSVINNMVIGVQSGYVKELEIQGVGYKAQLQGKTLVLTLGFSHDIKYEIPDGITVEINGSTEVKVSGHEKALVGQVAARIRAFAPAEPYKGKGVRYKGEQIRRKEGKAVA